MTQTPPLAGDRDDRSGSIYDLGYRGYEGPRQGRSSAIAALLIHSVRTAYGLGRSARSKIAPVVIVILALLPSLLALGFIALASQFGEAGEAIEFISPIRFSTLLPMTAIFVFLFCSAQAPELFGRDQQAGVLPLYFSRSISRIDYAMARFLGLLTSLLVLVLAPVLLLLVGRVLVEPNLADGLAEELPNLPPAIAIGLLTAVLMASVSGAIAALTPRRSYATIAIIVVFMIPIAVVSLLYEENGGSLAQFAVLLSIVDVLDGVNAALFDVRADNPAVRDSGLDDWVFYAAAAAWIVASLAILIRRYQKLEV